jgi:phosphoglycerate kinase
MKKDFFVIDDLPIQNKTILLRVDINSPVDPDTGKILGLARIKSHLKTIEKLESSRLVILGHQSKPGKVDYISLNAHAQNLRSLLKRPVKFVDDLIGKSAQTAIKKQEPGEIILLENSRFYAEELVLNQAPMDTLRNTHIVRNLAQVSNYYVNDAFAAAHRQQPTLVGFTEILPSAAGLVMEKELNALNKVLFSKEHPCLAVLGGAKVGDSLEVARNMLENKIADKILTTGVVANVFLMAKGYKLGTVNVDFLVVEFKNIKQLLETAKSLLKKYKDKIELPVEVVGNDNGERVALDVDRLPCDYPIHDIGLETVVKYSNMLKEAKAIIANGPAGVFEIEEFSFGTNEIFTAIANSKAYSVVGGGETITVIDKLGIHEDINHISTGGGACINYLAGRPLPVVEALKNSKKLFQQKIEKNKI